MMRRDSLRMEDAQNRKLDSYCRLVVRGGLPQDWEDWLQDVSTSVQPGGDAAGTVVVVSGAVIDRSALYGLLSALRDAGAEFISFEYISQNQEQAQ